MSFFFLFFFFNAPATTQISTLSLHDALPISRPFFPSERSTTLSARVCNRAEARAPNAHGTRGSLVPRSRSEEHTSELQSRRDLVCRLLLEKKNITKRRNGKQLN